MDKSSLGDRMKRYESVSKGILVPRTPVILRLDGCHFHTTTRGFKKPFDPVMIKAMQDTMKYLCEHIQGCVFGYTQSDEITLVLVDYQKINSSSWFDNEIQKMCSVAASMATYAFITYFKGHSLGNAMGDDTKYFLAHEKALQNGIAFDCRAFNVPKEEVCNCLIWRQQDATRNSIQSLAQANFPHKELQKLNCSQLQDKLMLEKGINWNNLSVVEKRGSACIKEKYTFENKNGEITERTRWKVDTEMPILTQDRAYVEDLVCF